MRKILAIFMIALIALAGCSSKDEAFNLTPAEAAKTLFEGVEVTNDQLMEAPKEVIEEWYNFDDKVSDFTVYVSSTSGTANEIAVVKSSDVKTAKAALEKRVEDLKERFKDYVPAEMTKLESPVIVTKGDTAIMVIADDTAKAQKLIDDLAK